jgi:hypothetical protein
MSSYAFITASIPHFYEVLQVTKPGGFTLPVLASPERSLPKRRIVHLYTCDPGSSWI